MLKVLGVLAVFVGLVDEKLDAELGKVGLGASMVGSDSALMIRCHSSPRIGREGIVQRALKRRGILWQGDIDLYVLELLAKREWEGINGTHRGRQVGRGSNISKEGETKTAPQLGLLPCMITDG